MIILIQIVSDQFEMKHTLLNQNMELDYGLHQGGDVSDYSWLDFLEDAGIDKRSDVHFNFTLQDDATICTIDNVNDFQKIEEFVLNKDKLKYLHAGSILVRTIYLDFEAMVRHGIDAIELDLTKNYSDLYYALYGWDVNSILIMNKDIIIPK